MKRDFYRFSKPGSMFRKVLLILLAVALSIRAEIAVGDTFVIWAGYGNFLGMSGGNTQATEVIDSSVTRGDTVFYHFNVINTKTEGFFESGGSMLPLIDTPMTQLAVLLTKPSTIQSNSPRFDELKWILSDRSSLLFFSSIEPISPYSLIPIDPSTEPYSENDFYTVRVTDTTGMKWTRVTSEYQWLQGQRMVFENRQDSIGTVRMDSLIAPACRNYPVWISADNPLNFFRFETSSRFYPLNGSNMVMGEGCYSTQITYYKPINTSVTVHRSVLSPVSVKTTRAFTLRGELLNAPNQTGVSLMVGNGQTLRTVKVR